MKISSFRHEFTHSNAELTRHLIRSMSTELSKRPITHRRANKLSAPVEAKKFTKHTKYPVTRRWSVKLNSGGAKRALPARLGLDLEEIGGSRHVPPKGTPANRWPPHLRQVPYFLVVPLRNSGQEHITSTGAPGGGGGGGVTKPRGSWPGLDDRTVP